MNIPSKNIPLKVALMEREKPDYQSAIEADLHPNKLSKIINGLQKPTEEEKQRLADVLNRAVDEIFPEPVTTA